MPALRPNRTSGGVDILEDLTDDQLHAVIARAQAVLLELQAAMRRLFCQSQLDYRTRAQERCHHVFSVLSLPRPRAPLARPAKSKLGRPTKSRRIGWYVMVPSPSSPPQLASWVHCYPLA
jgi:hypothetical protein